MRVIAGQFRSRLLKSVPGFDTRPTPDRLRETLFNVLAPRIEGVSFVDAYAGTGAVGIEALSRGAARAVFIERSRAALAVLRENLHSLDLLRSSNIVAGKAAAVVAQYPADIVFLDPPYEHEREYSACLEALSPTPPPLVIAQHASRFDLAPEWGRLRRVRLLKQGDNSLSFFTPAL
jgi:16S rRNA (guanine(966)-N(2))-methyltransferase RsmD